MSKNDNNKSLISTFCTSHIKISDLQHNNQGQVLHCTSPPGPPYVHSGKNKFLCNGNSMLNQIQVMNYTQIVLIVLRALKAILSEALKQDKLKTHFWPPPSKSTHLEKYRKKAYKISYFLFQTDLICSKGPHIPYLKYDGQKFGLFASYGQSLKWCFEHTSKSHALFWSLAFKFQVQRC